MHSNIHWMIPILLWFLLTKSCDTLCPNGYRVRKEFRDMTAEEWNQFKRELYLLAESPEYDKWTEIHIENSRNTHNAPQFFPWHRWFVLEFENLLRRLNRNITIPYWDWSYDSQDPLNSPILDEQHLFMKPGRRGDCSWRRLLSNPHCLIRDYDEDDFGTFHDVATIRRIIRNRRVDYDGFRALLEPSPHGRIHSSIGGSDGDFAHMTSPNDPIFWVHHSFIDKIWLDHQKITGKIYDYNGDHRRQRVSMSDKISGANITVYDVLDADTLCYTYQPFSRIRQGSSRESLTPLRQSMTSLLAPKQVPEEWLVMHGFNVTDVRLKEKVLENIMGSINNKISHGEILDPNNEVEDKYPLFNSATNLKSGSNVILFLVLFSLITTLLNK